MTETKVRCDICGKPAMLLQYDFSYYTDAAGATDTHFSTVDLCHEHAVARLQSFLEQPQHAGSNKQVEFADWVDMSAKFRAQQ